jgi:hypothetical protein
MTIILRHTWWYRSSLEPRCRQEGEAGGGRVHIPGGTGAVLSRVVGRKERQVHIPGGTGAVWSHVVGRKERQVEAGLTYLVVQEQS